MNNSHFTVLQRSAPLFIPYVQTAGSKEWLGFDKYLVKVPKDGEQLCKIILLGPANKTISCPGEMVLDLMLKIVQHCYTV